MNRRALGALAILAIATGLVGGMSLALLGGPGRVATAGSPSPAPSLGASPDPTGPPTPTPTPEPTPTPVPTPAPTPVLVPAPLTGRLVSPAVAAQRVIAVMIDDHSDARPQSGFSNAAVVWQAPAEGGIPRYMLVFQDRIPTDVGPVRSARLYYIAWAAEWRALYVHSGGSPGSLRALREQGNGQLVHNADEFRWGRYFRRVFEGGRFAPHNLYTTGAQLRELAAQVGADDAATPPAPAWRFGPDLPLEWRPTGGTISTAYSTSRITYTYDRTTNTYLRSVTKDEEQADAATGVRVAPKNVVVLHVRFGALNDGSNKKRLEADVIGSGKAWIATNGTTIQGTWRKDGDTEPIRFFDAAGEPVTLTVGQTFVQVMPSGTKVEIVAGDPPPRGTPRPDDHATD